MQRCDKDDQLLSYQYKEMTAQEEAEFEAHLSSCPACRAALHRDRTVRAAFQGLPEVAPSEAAWDRMTAELMGQAAPPQQAPVPPVGKILPWRRRKLLGYLFHPAAGVTAAAAAALLIVVARSEKVHLEPASAPAAAPTLSAEAGAKPEQPVPVPAVTALSPEDRTSKDEEKPTARPPAPGHAGKPARMAAPATRVAGPSKVGSLGSNEGGGGAGPAATGGAQPQAPQAEADLPAEVAVKDPDDRLTNRRQERPAQPEPPAPPPDNQQAQAPAGSADQAEVMAEVNQALASQVQGARRNDFDGALARRAPGGDNGSLQKDSANQAAPTADKSFAAPLARLRDDMRNGRCKEAADEMSQILKNQRETVPREDLLRYQQTCQPRPAEFDPEQQVQQVQGNMTKPPMDRPMERAEKRRAPPKAAAKAKK